MKLIDIIWKEISLIKAQKIALVLIFLYPFIVIGLLGSAFTGGFDATKASGTKIGFVNDLDFNSKIIDNMASSENLSIITYSDENSLREALLSKKVISGIVLKGDSPNKQLRVDLLYDNSNLLSSRFFMEIAKAVMQRITMDVAQKQLGEIWKTMTSFGANVNEEIKNVEDFKAQLISAEDSLNDLESDMNKFDFAEIESILSSQKNTVASYNSKIDSFEENVAKFKDSYEIARDSYSTFRSKINSYDSKLNALITGLDVAIKDIDEIKQLLLSVQSTLPEGVAKQSITDSLTKIESIREEIVIEKEFLDNLLELFLEIKDEQSKINIAFREADDVFDEIDSETQGLESAVNSSSTAITTMDSKLQLFKESIDEVKALIKNARSSKETIESKLNASSVLLSTFSTQLVEFGNIDPKVLAQPVIFYESRLFEVGSFGILVSNALVVVLILTCMLLTSIIFIMEKTENVTLRLELSPTSKFTLFTGKIIGQLVIALIEAGIIFIVAFAKIPLPFPILGVTQLGFGLVSSVSLIELVLAVILVSVTFICIGLLIASFVKNQSTAILTSLLLIVPMLFLSGIVLPLEFMEPFMQMVSSFLPMTVANNLLIGLLIKGFSLTQLWLEIILLIFYCVLALVIVFLKNKY